MKFDSEDEDFLEFWKSLKNSKVQVPMTKKPMSAVPPPKKTYLGPWILVKDLQGDWYIIPKKHKENWQQDVINDAKPIPKYAEYLIEPEELIIGEYEISE